MLPLQRCREVLGDGFCGSDEQLELLREQLYAIAGAVTALFARRPGAPGAEVRQPGGFQEAVALLSWDERIDLEERAAIYQFDGGQPRDVAERTAFTDYCRRNKRGGQDAQEKG